MSNFTPLRFVFTNAIVVVTALNVSGCASCFAFVPGHPLGAPAFAVECKDFDSGALVEHVTVTSRIDLERLQAVRCIAGRLEIKVDGDVTLPSLERVGRNIAVHARDGAAVAFPNLAHADFMYVSGKPASVSAPKYTRELRVGDAENDADDAAVDAPLARRH